MGRKNNKSRRRKQREAKKRAFDERVAARNQVRDCVVLESRKQTHAMFGFSKDLVHCLFSFVVETDESERADNLLRRLIFVFRNLAGQKSRCLEEYNTWEEPLPYEHLQEVCRVMHNCNSEYMRIRQTCKATKKDQIRIEQSEFRDFEDSEINHLMINIRPVEGSHYTVAPEILLPPPSKTCSICSCNFSCKIHNPNSMFCRAILPCQCKNYCINCMFAYSERTQRMTFEWADDFRRFRCPDCYTDAYFDIHRNPASTKNLWGILSTEEEFLLGGIYIEYDF